MTVLEEPRAGGRMLPVPFSAPELARRERVCGGDAPRRRPETRAGAAEEADRDEERFAFGAGALDVDRVRKGYRFSVWRAKRLAP